MRCDHCGAQVPPGVFCTVCGAHQSATLDPEAARTRLHRYAAHPGEHVTHPNIFSTILPHLDHHRVLHLRHAFTAGLALIAVLYLAGLIGAALLASAVLFPAVYVAYLYEAALYRDEPVRVLGLTAGAGVVLGIVVSVVVDRVLGSEVLLASRFEPGALLLLTVVVPVIAELLKPLAPTALRRDYGETVDGVVFGVATGFGFAAAQTVVGYAPVLGVLPVHVAPENWVYALITTAVTLPLLQGCCTGAFTAAIWGALRHGATALEIAGVAVALIAHVAFTLFSQRMQQDGVQPLLVVVVQLVIVAAVIVYMRLLIHAALLEEATDVQLRRTFCVSCHRHVDAARFCPHCGRALGAAPATGAAVEATV